ncbi:MAG: hypothetical protein H7096_06335 [Flavobacterium sp.]|nr:hypothetical protein [Pedobacter sp.]
MRKFIVYATVFSIIGFQISCKKTASEFCGGKNPAESLSWLKTKIQNLNTSTLCQSISRSKYKNQTVFILSSCDPLAIGIPVLYNCEGNQLKLTDAEYQNLGFTGGIELIWKNK